MSRQTSKEVDKFFHTAAHVEAPNRAVLAFRVNRIEDLPGHFESFDAALADARRLRNGQPVGTDIAMFARRGPGVNKWQQIYCWSISEDGLVGGGHLVDDRVPA